MFNFKINSASANFSWPVKVVIGTSGKWDKCMVQDTWEWKVQVFGFNFQTECVHLFPLSFSVSYFLPPTAYKTCFLLNYTDCTFRISNSTRKLKTYFESLSSLAKFALHVGSWTYHWELISYDFGTQFAV